MIGVVLAALMTVTNLAGRVISVEPVEIKDERVVLRGGGGHAGRVTLPMSVFPKSEQKRIKAALGRGTRPACPSADEMPGKLRPLASELATQRRRDEARLAAKRLKPEKAAENAADRLGSWRHAVDISNLSDEEKKRWRNYNP